MNTKIIIVGGILVVAVPFLFLFGSGDGGKSIKDLETGVSAHVSTLDLGIPNESHTEVKEETIDGKEYSVFSYTWNQSLDDTLTFNNTTYDISEVYMPQGVEVYVDKDTEEIVETAIMR